MTFITKVLYVETYHEFVVYIMPVITCDTSRLSRLAQVVKKICGGIFNGYWPSISLAFTGKGTFLVFLHLLVSLLKVMTSAQPALYQRSIVLMITP